MENKNHRPPIETLACPYSDCHLYARTAAGNLTVRKLYGKDRIRYLRCRACAREFSERRNTALFNSKIEERKAISVAEHLAEGLSTKATSRLVGVSAEAVIRELMESTRKRINSPKDLVLMSDGHNSYESLFPSIFGEPYRLARKGVRGRFPKVRHRINRSLAHLQLIKKRRWGGRVVVEVKPRVAHGSWKRVEKELEQLGYDKPNL